MRAFSSAGHTVATAATQLCRHSREAAEDGVSASGRSHVPVTLQGQELVRRDVGATVSRPLVSAPCSHPPRGSQGALLVPDVTSAPAAPWPVAGAQEGPVNTCEDHTAWPPHSLVMPSDLGAAQSPPGARPCGRSRQQLVWFPVHDGDPGASEALLIGPPHAAHEKGAVTTPPSQTGTLSPSAPPGTRWSQVWARWPPRPGQRTLRLQRRKCLMSSPRKRLGQNWTRTFLLPSPRPPPWALLTCDVATPLAFSPSP